MGSDPLGLTVVAGRLETDEELAKRLRVPVEHVTIARRELGATSCMARKRSARRVHDHADAE